MRCPKFARQRGSSRAYLRSAGAGSAAGLVHERCASQWSGRDARSPHTGGVDVRVIMFDYFCSREASGFFKSPLHTFFTRLATQHSPGHGHGQFAHHNKGVLRREHLLIVHDLHNRVFGGCGDVGSGDALRVVLDLAAAERRKRLDE